MEQRWPCFADGSFQVHLTQQGIGLFQCFVASLCNPNLFQMRACTVPSSGDRRNLSDRCRSWWGRKRPRLCGWSVAGTRRRPWRIPWRCLSRGLSLSRVDVLWSDHIIKHRYAKEWSRRSGEIHKRSSRVEEDFASDIILSGFLATVLFVYIDHKSI